MKTIFKLISIILIQMLVCPSCIFAMSSPCFEYCRIDRQNLAAQTALQIPLLQEAYKNLYKTLDLSMKSKKKNSKYTKNPEKVLFRWAKKAVIEDPNKAWSPREIGKKVRMSKSTVSKYLEQVQMLLKREGLPVLKIKTVIDAKEILLTWAEKQDPDIIWTQKEIAAATGLGQSTVSKHIETVQKDLEKNKLPQLKLRLSSFEKILEWVLGRNQRQVEKNWSVSEIARRLGMGVNTVAEYLPEVQQALEKQKKPAIKIGLDAEEELFTWAKVQVQENPDRVWQKRQIADSAGISESSVYNHIGTVQIRLESFSLPRLKLETDTHPSEKIYRWAIRRSYRDSKKFFTKEEIAEKSGAGEYAVRIYLNDVQKRLPRGKKIMVLERAKDPGKTLYEWAVKRSPREQEREWTQARIARINRLAPSTISKYLPKVQKRLKSEHKPEIKLKEEITTENKILNWAINRTKVEIDKTWTQREIAAAVGVSKFPISVALNKVQEILRKKKLPLVKTFISTEEKLFYWARIRDKEEKGKTWKLSEIARATRMKLETVKKYIIIVNEQLEKAGQPEVKTNIDDKLEPIKISKNKIDGLLNDMEKDVYLLASENNDRLRKFFWLRFFHCNDAKVLLKNLSSAGDFFPEYDTYKETVERLLDMLEVDRGDRSLMKARIKQIAEIFAVFRKKKGQLFKNLDTGLALKEYETINFPKRVSDFIPAYMRFDEIMVLDNRGEGKRLEKLPVVRVSRLSSEIKRQLAESLERWFNFDVLRPVAHGPEIAMYRWFFEHNGEGFDELFLAVSLHNNKLEIEGLLDLNVNQHAFIELAPWNRGLPYGNRRYLGVGFELRTLGIKRLLKQDPQINNRMTLSKIIMLGYREPKVGADVFYGEIVKEDVEEYLKNHQQKRQKLIERFSPGLSKEEKNKFLEKFVFTNRHQSLLIEQAI